MRHTRAGELAAALAAVVEEQRSDEAVTPAERAIDALVALLAELPRRLPVFGGGFLLSAAAGSE